jgi:hypothetical protein
LHHLPFRPFLPLQKTYRSSHWLTPSLKSALSGQTSYIFHHQNMNIYVAGCFETSVPFDQLIQRHIPGDSNFHIRKNLKCHSETLNNNLIRHIDIMNVYSADARFESPTCYPLSLLHSPRKTVQPWF